MQNDVASLDPNTDEGTRASPVLAKKTKHECLIGRFQPFHPLGTEAEEPSIGTGTRISRFPKSNDGRTRLGICARACVQLPSLLLLLCNLIGALCFAELILFALATSFDSTVHAIVSNANFACRGGTPLVRIHGELWQRLTLW